MGHTVSIRVFDDKQEVSKIALEDLTVYREGILSVSGNTTYAEVVPAAGANVFLLSTSSPAATIAIDTACSDILLWSDDIQEKGDEFRIIVQQYVGLGVDGDGDGAGTLSTSAEKSLNKCNLLVAKLVAGVYKLASAVADGGTTITTGAGLLNNSPVFLSTPIVARKLCALVPLVKCAGSSVYINISKNKNARRIHWHIYKR